MTQEQLLTLCQENDLPVEAIDAAYNGGKWTEWEEPEDREVMIQVPSYCSDCGKYHRGFLFRGLRIEEGKLFVTEWYSEDDDSMDCADEIEIETQEEFAREWLNWLEDRKWMDEEWLGYWEHVAETGKDDIEEVWYLRTNEGESEEEAMKRMARHEVESLSKRLQA